MPIGKRTGYKAGVQHGHSKGYSDAIQAVRTKLQRSIDLLQQDIVESFSSLPRPKTPVASAAPARVPPSPRTPPSPRAPKLATRAGNGAHPHLSKAERLILTALARYPQGRSKVQVAVLTRYAHTGGGFNNALGALRSHGLLHGDQAHLKITEVGLKVLGEFDPLPQGQELLEHWLRQLGKAERAALQALVEVYPRQLTKEELAQRAGYEAAGGGFNNALSRLRTLELIGGRGELRASEDLF